MNVSMNGNVVQSREHLIDDCCNTAPVILDRTKPINELLDLCIVN
jgi:hypothetical protein